MNLIAITLTLAGFINGGFSAKILGVFPAPSRSHRNLYNPLMMELVKRGHEVIVISPFLEENSSKNGTYRNIQVTGLNEWMQEMLGGMKPYETVESNPIIGIIFSSHFMNHITNETLLNENVQKLIHSGEKFDLVVTTALVNHAHKALATHFGAPLVLFSTLGPNLFFNHLTGNPAPPSYVPDIFLSYSGHLSFTERIINSAVIFFGRLFTEFIVNPVQDAMIQKYIPGGVDINDVIYNISLVLLNSHPSFSQPVPKVPNMIEIGGFHVEPPKKLPQDLQSYLDSALDGVIYFSMGSNLKSSALPEKQREAFLKTFSKLKEKILWKWEEDVLPGQPTNVKLGKWLPQQDILAHPNVKLFITHGGLLSTIETIYHGVPVLAIPIFGDQKMNAKTAVQNGYGLSLAFNDITEGTLTNQIMELLTNTKYSKEAKRRSKIFHDRLANPMETAIYWLEYVIRHKGAPHLRVAALDLTWYQYHLLDVGLFLLVVMVLFVKMLISMLRMCCGKRKLNKVKQN